MNRLSNLFSSKSLFYLAWLVGGVGLTGWMVYELQANPPVEEIESTSSAFNVNELVEAAGLVDEDELTLNAPSATVEIDPAEASDSAEENTINP